MNARDFQPPPEPPKQVDFWGNEAPPDNIIERIEKILEDNPQACNSYKSVMVLYWLWYDGLDAILDKKTFIAFQKWFIEKATSPKTLQNRAMEIQRRRPDLDANPTVREWRDRQGKAGPVT